MKRILFTLTAIVCILSAKAQKTDTVKNNDSDNKIYTSVEHPPQFPGGIDQFYRFLVKTIRYPSVAYEHHLQGKVLLSMIVEKDGALTNIKVARGVSVDIDKEALRVMNLSPKWEPAIENGKPVRVDFIVPINFTLAD